MITVTTSNLTAIELRAIQHGMSRYNATHEADTVSTASQFLERVLTEEILPRLIEREAHNYANQNVKPIDFKNLTNTDRDSIKTIIDARRS